jgi:hypothetical protein
LGDEEEHTLSSILAELERRKLIGSLPNQTAAHSCAPAPALLDCFNNDALADMMALVLGRP